MAFAKLSGALLVRKDDRAPATISTLVSVPATSVTVLPDESANSRLAENLKALKLSAFLREYERLAQQCIGAGSDHSRFLLRLSELELAHRKRKGIERRIKAAHFPIAKELDTFNFTAIPTLDKHLVLELMKCKYIKYRENIVIFGDSFTGKTHIAVALGLAACRRGLSVGFVTAVSLSHQLLEARRDQCFMRLRRRFSAYELLIIDELGYVPLPAGGAELMFDIIGQRYERSSTIVTSNLPLGQWRSVFGASALTAAALNRLTRQVHILKMRGQAYCDQFTGSALSRW